MLLEGFGGDKENGTQTGRVSFITGRASAGVQATHRKFSLSLHFSPHRLSNRTLTIAYPV